MNAPLYLQETLADDCLLFDGMTQSGKMLAAPLISDLPGIDYAATTNVLDDISWLWRLGKIDDNAATVLLRQTLNACIYERAVGRHMNTRRDDFYSVRRSIRAEEYLQRAEGDEGPAVMNHFNDQGKVASFSVHHQLPSSDLWFAAFPAIKFIITVRHPVDLCHAWNGRGWGERWGGDPLAFSLCADVDGTAVPWWCLDFADDYIALAPIDRVVKSILALTRLYAEAHAALDAERAKRVKVVAFEKIAADPMPVLTELAQWLKTDVPADMAKVMERERVPRELDPREAVAKFGELCKTVRPKLMDELVGASLAYETEWDLAPATTQHGT